jgi:hypothetical protein
MFYHKVILFLLFICTYISLISGAIYDDGLSTRLSCQGTNYLQALSNCDDGGKQKYSAGGNVSIYVKSANNLPNRDHTGPSSGISDPYVKFTVGDTTAQSSVVRNNLNPHWDEMVNIGFLGSATEIIVEIWDHDIGLEFDDDLLVRTTFRVPFCTTITANYTTETCSTPFGCSVDDSSWAMPTRQMCNNSGTISFVDGFRCHSVKGICLQIDVIIIPFTMEIELENKPAALIRTPQLSVAGGTLSRAWWTADFGTPFIGNDDVLKMDFTDTKYLVGALMLRQLNKERAKGREGIVKFYVSINYPAYIYVCRDISDNERSIPNWIKQQYSSTNTSTMRLQIVGKDEYACFYRFADATQRNRDGGIINGALEFYTNTVEDYDSGIVENEIYYDNMYIILAVPKVIAARDETVIIYFDNSLFLNTLFTFGLIFTWFMFLVAKFLKKIDYRIDRVMTFLITRVLSGEDKNILAALFMRYEETPCNVEYRSHLFHARNILLFMFSLPFFLLISWGSSCSLIRPSALGFAVSFLGMSSICLWFGFRLWEKNSWRMSPIAIISISSSIILFLCFIISVIFVDPAVQLYNKSLNFAALGLLFGTINTFPLLLLVFRQDKTYKINLRYLVNKMADAVHKIKNPGQKKGPAKYVPANKLLHALLGNYYTINPNVPLFRFATVLQEPPKDGEIAAALELAALQAGSKKPTDKNDEEEDISDGDETYNISLIILVIYIIIAMTSTDYPSIAFVNCLSLILFDTIHTAISRSDVNWSPGFKIFLLVIGRITVMGSSGDHWLLNYSIAYMIYSTALLAEVINGILPMLTQRQASVVAFAGKDDEKKPNLDMAGTAEFCYGILTFCFISLLLVSAFGGTDEVLPTPNLEVWGASWPVYVFGLISFLLTITSGFGMATVRSFYLKKHNLLRGWARDNYMLRKDVNVPIIFAFLTELSIVSSGVLVFGATESNSVLTCCIFVPVIVVCLGYAYGVWIENDYDLVVWPPVDVTNAASNDSPSDMEVAFHMIENLFGDEEDVGNQEQDEIDGVREKTMKGFKLPALEATGSKVDAPVKMPALPLKSVLRRKRQNLGIKVKNPLVKDLRGRDGSDGDKFGSGGDDDVIDANDAWAQFEETEDDIKRRKPKKKAAQFKLGDRQGIMNHPEILKIKAKFMGTKTGQLIYKTISDCMSSFSKRGKKKVYGDSEFSELNEEEEDDDEDAKDDDEEEDVGPASENLDKMPFWSAVMGGFLSGDEYKALFAWFFGMFLILMLGVTLSKTLETAWFGYVIWVGSWTFILTYIPVIKYFNTYEVDSTMKQLTYFNCLMHFIFCLVYWLNVLEGDIGIAPSLWILDYFFYYPTFLYIFVEFYKWGDDGYKIEALDKDGDGDITIQEYIEYFKAYPILLVLMLLLNWQFYLWISSLLGKIFALLLFCTAVGYLFVRDWAINNFFLSPGFAKLGHFLSQVTMLVSLATALLSSENPSFSLSIFCFVFIFSSISKIASRFMIADADTIIFFSPFVMPVYSYDPRTNDVVDETPIAKEFISALLVGSIWGAIMAVFLYPVDVGIGVACMFLLVISAIISACVSYVPLELGRYSAMLNPDNIADAASAAAGKAADRKLPINIEMHEWEGDFPDDLAAKDLTTLQKHKQKTALEIAATIIDDTRALTFVRDDSAYIESKKETIIDGIEEETTPWYLQYYRDVMEILTGLFELIPIGQMRGWRKHSEALFSIDDAIAEALITGKGSFGFIGMEGLWFHLLTKAQEHPKLKFLQQPWLQAYDINGNSKNVLLLSEHVHTQIILREYRDLDLALDHNFKEETRCAVHFLLMLIVAADAKMQRETVLFQKFLRENRFRLASNGISPPGEIFSSSSFSSIDIPLVAVWLSTLSSEERERFYMLKETFSEEQKIRDEAIDAADYQLAFDAMTLKQERIAREIEVAENVHRELNRRQLMRIQAFIETLNQYDKNRFTSVRERWLSNADCDVDPKDRPLYEKYRDACMSPEDETIEYGRAVLADIEAAQKDCRLGEYGRAYQFVDSEFPPGDTALGVGDANALVLGWRCAPGISDIAQLFDGGTDPDDVEQGLFKNDWLLSALSMLAAAGGVGDGGVDAQIANLFVGHYGMDGELTYDTEVGGYCVRLYKQGIWNPIIVDDLFPMLTHDNWTNENRGMASAHSKECTELWVSIIEKAFAKYYGSYYALEQGYVQHALEDMTGCEAECIFLSNASRGPGKMALWDQLIRFKSNGYILGCGTGSAALADKEIQDMGIIFNAAYVIYDVRLVDGHKLLKLRNPPGDHDEWKGDWSDKSELWTRRLKGKCEMSDEDDNTFFMSFDDFCNVFRQLYVCKWYDPETWTEVHYPGIWKKADAETAIQQEAVKKSLESVGESQDKNAKKEDALILAKAKIDTAGGLPTKHNPACVLENNCHFSMRVNRPTDLRITVTQADSRGKANEVVQPFSIFIVKNSHPEVPARLQSLSKENVVSFSEEPKFERTQHLYATLKPGLFIILIAPYMTGMEGNFTVTLLSNYKTVFEPLWPPKWMIMQDDSNALKSLNADGTSKNQQKVDGFTKFITNAMSSFTGGDYIESEDEEEEEEDV